MTGLSARLRELTRDRDVAIGYVFVVTCSCVALWLAPTALNRRLVAQSSTNVANLHDHPLTVLFVSAFVEPSGFELLLLAVPLVLAVGASQRWLGRLPTITAMAFGHVGASLFVATLITAGITHGAISRSVLHARDVGVSYALVAVLGLLSARLQRPWRVRWVLAWSAVFLAALLADQTFTDLGHLIAWVIGLGLAVIAADRSRSPVDSAAARSSG